MAKWEIALAVCDEPENWRKKKGDVIAFKPAPWNWGKKELDQYLIVIVDGMTQDEVVQLCKPMYEGGETNEEIIIANRMKPIGKRRYKLPLGILRAGWLPSLDLQKVADKNMVYQLLKENNIVIDALEKVAIFQDKFTGTYKYIRRRKA
jgi:serine/threonine protein phosphatase PrpC